MTRSTWIALGTVSVALLVAAAVLWLWWPDSNKLTGYAARGDIAGVRLSLRLGVDPNEPSRWGWRHETPGQTPLTAAAQFGRVDVVRLLLEKGADPNLLDAGPEFPHETPLSTAAMHGQLEVCRALLEAGADPNIPTNPKQSGDPANWTALDWALQSNRTDVADFLRQHGAVEGKRRVEPATRSEDPTGAAVSSVFTGARGGSEREVVGVRLCWCPAGRFLMGSPPEEPERRPGEDQVEVTLSKGFWMGKYETTQKEWKRIIGNLPGEPTQELPDGDDYPLGNVNFAEAEAYCQKLTLTGHQTGELPSDWEFRLPTEAQWEFACRAGTTTATSFGDTLSSTQANFQGQPYNGAERGPSLRRAATVGSYPANAWGLHDMHGNTFEWCRDWYHQKLPGGTDPDLYQARDSASRSEHGDLSRVRRGGCWADDGWACRSAFRLRFEPERRYDHIGFRVVVVQP